MDAGDRATGNADLTRRHEIGSQSRLIQRNQNLALCRDALPRLDHAALQLIGLHDVSRKDIRSRLCADLQQVAEAFRHYQYGRRALALQQRIGRHGRAHPYHGDVAAAMIGQYGAHGFHGRIGISPRILGQQLANNIASIGRARHDVSKSAAPIDPEMPSCHHLTVGLRDGL